MLSITNVILLFGVLRFKEGVMPAKKVIFEKDVMAAALDLIRERGENSLNARDLAKKINCSTQPIYSIYKNMQGVEEAVRQAAARVLDEYMTNELKNGKYIGNQAIGMGYVRFAAEEKCLYRYLYMKTPQQRSDINVELTKKSVGFIMQKYGLDEQSATKYFAEIWIFSHGIASMVACDRLDFDEEKIREAFNDVATGLGLRFKNKGN